MFKIKFCCVEFLEKLGGLQALGQNLQNSPDNLGLMYYTMLNIWVLSFHKESYPHFLKRDKIPLIKKMITVIEIIAKEKILRVAFGTFMVTPSFHPQNLIDSCPEICELMLDSGLLKMVELYINHNLKDEELKENLEKIGERLESEQKIFTSYEKYQKEMYNYEQGYS